MKKLTSNGRRTLVVLGITVLVLGAAGVALAQGHGMGQGHGKGHGQGIDHGMRMQAMFTRLDLNEEQQAAIEKIHEDAQAKQQATRKDLMRLRNELEGELLKDEPNEKTALELTGKIGELRTAQQQNRLATRLAVRELLTPEQRDKMLLMHEGQGRGGRHQGHMGRHGGRGRGCGQSGGYGHGRHGGDCPLEKTES